MTKARVLRTNLHVHQRFQRPLLRWEDAFGRFCEMIYDAQSPTIPVFPKEFSIQPSSNVAEVRAKYNIYGGASTITLSAERLSFEFPGMVEQENAIALGIMGAVHAKFPLAFPELTYERVDVEAYQHLELLDGVTPDTFLSKFQNPTVERLARDELGAVVHPALKFEAIAADQSWRCIFSLERSLLNATAVFLVFQPSLLKAAPEKDFSQMAEEVQNIAKKLLEAVGLEGGNADNA